MKKIKRATTTEEELTLWQIYWEGGKFYVLLRWTYKGLSGKEESKYEKYEKGFSSFKKAQEWISSATGISFENL